MGKCLCEHIRQMNIVQVCSNYYQLQQFNETLGHCNNDLRHYIVKQKKKKLFTKVSEVASAKARMWLDACLYDLKYISGRKMTRQDMGYPK